MGLAAFNRRRRQLAEAAAKAAEAKAKETEGKQKSVDRMKKDELVALATSLDLDAEGTVAELRKRIEAVQGAVDGGGEGADQLD